MPIPNPNSSGLPLHDDDMVVLNVGGVRYQTHRSTLTAYPETMLGTMFHRRNNSMLHPTKGNEHYIDRDGYLFSYVMKFYRTGRVPKVEDLASEFPISQAELDRELDFYMIPRLRKLPRSRPVERLSPRATGIAAEIDEFVRALRCMITELFLHFKEEFLINRLFPTSVQLTFHERKRMSIYVIAPPSNILSRLQEIIQPYESIGYVLLERYGEYIGQWFERSVTGIEWDLVKREKRLGDGDAIKLYDLRISLNDSFDRDEIVGKSCIGVHSMATRDEQCTGERVVGGGRKDEGKERD